MSLVLPGLTLRFTVLDVTRLALRVLDMTLYPHDATNIIFLPA